MSGLWVAKVAKVATWWPTRNAIKRDKTSSHTCPRAACRFASENDRWPWPPWPPLATTPNKDPRIAAAAVALWNAFDYTLPAPPADVARIVIEAADNAKDHRQ